MEQQTVGALLTAGKAAVAAGDRSAAAQQLHEATKVRLRRNGCQCCWWGLDHLLLPAGSGGGGTGLCLTYAPSCLGSCRPASRKMFPRSTPGLGLYSCSATLAAWCA